VQIDLGSNAVLPELDAGLIGASVDGTLDVDAKMPDSHPRKELAGKVARFHVQVKDLKLNEKNPLDVPPSLVEQQCRMMEMEIMQNARRAGQRVTQEDFQRVHGRVHADAEKKVRAGLLMAAIAKKLELRVTDQDIQNGIEELAADSGKNVAKVRAEYSDPQHRQILIGMILEDKVLTHIESKANIQTGAPMAEAAPAVDAAKAEPAAAAPSPSDVQASEGGAE
jgi:trigger factor